LLGTRRFAELVRAFNVCWQKAVKNALPFIWQSDYCCDNADKEPVPVFFVTQPKEPSPWLPLAPLA
jgi:hypothetical protein